MKKIIAFLTVTALSLVLIVGVSANDKIFKAHKANPDAKVNGKDLTCTYCHGTKPGQIEKKKGQGLKKGEANYAKTKADALCAPCHK